MKYEIVRTDLSNKIVLPATEFRDAEDAMGNYIFALTMAGILKSADDYTHNGGTSYTLKNGWKLEVSEA